MIRRWFSFIWIWVEIQTACSYRPYGAIERINGDCQRCDCWCSQESNGKKSCEAYLEWGFPSSIIRQFRCDPQSRGHFPGPGVCMFVCLGVVVTRYKDPGQMNTSVEINKNWPGILVGVIMMVTQETLQAINLSNLKISISWPIFHQSLPLIARTSAFYVFQLRHLTQANRRSSFRVKWRRLAKIE
jgi:hypothetical protein